MERIVKTLSPILTEYSEKMKISFDWDNTISMSYMDEETVEPKFIHQGYNQEFIDKMLNYIKEGHENNLFSGKLWLLSTS